MNYFGLYEMPVSFLPDAAQVRKKYLELSKKISPRFYGTASTEKQSKILELSTLNNKAFQTLSDFGKTMKYICWKKDFL